MVTADEDTLWRLNDDDGLHGMGKEDNRDGTTPCVAAASRTLYAPVKESQAWLKQDDFTSPCAAAMEPLTTTTHPQGSWADNGRSAGRKAGTTMPIEDRLVTAMTERRHLVVVE